MKTIENVQTIGIYLDEIRIISKNEPPQSVKRSTHRLSTTDVVRVVDEVAGREKRIAIHMKDGVHCNITDTEVKCGWFIGQTFYLAEQPHYLSEKLKHDRGGFDF